MRKAQKNENFMTVQRFYMRLFDSFSEICALFKVNLRFILDYVILYKLFCISRFGVKLFFLTLPLYNFLD